MHGLCFHKTSNLMGKTDHEQKELSRKWEMKAMRSSEELIFLQEQRAEKMPQRLVDQTRGCSGRPSSRKQQQEGESMESGPCLHMTQKRWLPCLVADEGRSRGQSFVTSFISVPRRSRWNRAANTDRPAHKSDPHSGFSAAPRSAF